MSRCLLVIRCALTAVALSGAAGHAAEADPSARPVPLSPTLYSVMTYGLRNPACRQWTDRCVVCTQAGCSNIGVACQPQDIVCTDPTPPPAK